MHYHSSSSSYIPIHLKFPSLLSPHNSTVCTAMTTPEPLPGIHTVDFRAPPPSPVAPGRRSSFANNDVLTEYLQQSLKVPDLVLPDKVFPRHKSQQTPPKIDFQNLDLMEIESGVEISQSIAQLGCLEVINHGISTDLIKFVLELANGVFNIPPERKRMVGRSPDRRYGFEEIHEDEEEKIRDETEEFIWSGEEAMRQEMEGIWPFRYSNFSQEMKNLSTQMGEIGQKILQFLQQHSLVRISSAGDGDYDPEACGSTWCVQKHWKRKEGVLSGMNSVRYDVIRMMIRGSEFPHALCLHICSGTADFHVYSRKGWLSFCPNQDSIVLTVGDNLQAWSGGQYKHVIGRPVFKGEDEICSHISMGFLYSPPNMTINDEKDNTISVTNQIILAILLTLVYQFALYILSYTK